MGKIVNGVANDYDYEQLEDWNKHLKYCQSSEPTTIYLGKYTLLDNLVERIKNTKSVDIETIKDLCICFKMIYELKEKGDE